jgi:hypothetical protein
MTAITARDSFWVENEIYAGPYLAEQTSSPTLVGWDELLREGGECPGTGFRVMCHGRGNDPGPT